MFRSSRQKGASLLELLLASACVLLLLHFSLSTLSGVGRKLQHRRLWENLEQSIQLAKHEAMATQQTITLCHSPDGRHCASSPYWQHYWLVGPLDPKTRRINPVLTVHSIPHEGSLSLRAFKGGLKSTLTLRPDGTTLNNGTFRYHDPSAALGAPIGVLRVNNAARTYREVSH